MDKKKTLNHYLTSPYTIELTPDADGYWFASIPLLPGCMTQGASREEALANIDEAKRLWLETALAEGKKVSEPFPPENPQPLKKIAFTISPDTLLVLHGDLYIPLADRMQQLLSVARRKLLVEVFYTDDSDQIAKDRVK